MNNKTFRSTSYSRGEPGWVNGLVAGSSVVIGILFYIFQSTSVEAATSNEKMPLVELSESPLDADQGLIDDGKFMLDFLDSAIPRITPKNQPRNGGEIGCELIYPQ